MGLKDALNNLSSNDIYSLMLFALYKLRDVPQYSALSELVYILDRESLLKLCEYYGGLTIKIPTINDIESVVYSLILYEYVDVEGMKYEDAIKKLGYKTTDLRKIKSDYIALKTVLKDFSFNRGCGSNQ